MSDRTISNPVRPPRSSRVLREPLAHFLLLGLLLFAAHRLIQGPPTMGANRIEITAEDIARVEFGWQARWQRPPTAAEMRGMMDSNLPMTAQDVDLLAP